MDAIARHTAQPPTLYANLKLCFMPFVGFFNFIICIYHKVHVLQKAAGDDSGTFLEIFVLTWPTNFSNRIIHGGAACICGGQGIAVVLERG